LVKATDYIEKFPDDSLKNNLLFDISYHYYKQQDSLKFRFWNTRTLELSEKLNDTMKIGESYWDLAGFFNNTNVYDSSYIYYSRAQKSYQNVDAKFESSRMLLNLALLQSNVKDYVGSEATTIRAIRTFKRLEKYNQLYMSYNNLGIINNELNSYQKSLFYHGKALEIESILNNSILKASTLNNIGVVHRNNNDYQKSIEFYNQAFETDSLFIKNPRLYAMLLDNKAYSRFKLKDTLGLKDEFSEALYIRDSINHIAGIITNKLHLGEYYLYSKKYNKAFIETNEAKLLSKEFNSFGDYLESLILLSKIDTENAEDYYKEYINLSDSLQNEERAIRNKFARIRFETDEFIAENEDLSKENFWIISGASSLILLMAFIYIIRIEKNRNRKMLMKQKQQLANEEIYNLLIDSQNKLDEGREKEKKRISKELHDGILSKFFGVRLNLELLNNSINDESIIQREKYIHELKKLENEIRRVSHQLNDDMFSNENSFKTITQEFLNAQMGLGKFKYILNFDKTIVWDEVSSKIKINVYRIIQESIHNISKYSEASFVEINFIKINNKLKVEVKDDGIGFDTKLTSEGIGIKNMKSRIKDLSGEILFTSSNSGTEIIMYIPLNY